MMLVCCLASGWSRCFVGKYNYHSMTYACVRARRAAEGGAPQTRAIRSKSVWPACQHMRLIEFGPNRWDGGGHWACNQAPNARVEFGVQADVRYGSRGSAHTNKFLATVMGLWLWESIKGGFLSGKVCEFD